MAGRRLLLTEALITQFKEHVSLGFTQKRASIALGVSYRSVCGWLAIGRELLEAGHKGRSKKEKLCLGLAREFNDAKTAFIKRHLAVITKDAIKNKNPKSSQWLLSTLFPEDYGKKQTVDHNMKGDVKVKCPAAIAIEKVAAFVADKEKDGEE